MSFMDVIIGTALTLLIFTALVGLLRSSIQVAALAKTRSIATAVAESQMEYIRSLSYDSVGTVGGIPAGPVPQVSTTTQNGIDFPVRTFIGYVDDPADGTGSSDSTGITTDYKRIKVSVTYFANGRTQVLELVSSYAPPGLETTTNGGTLKVSVVNAAGTGVAGASVRILNSSLSPTVDLTTFSDSQGTVFLPGAPTSTEYQVFVSKSGYSSAQTYARDATNQNPTPGYLTVVKGQTTTGTFAIDLLASLAVHTFLPIATSTFSDPFTSSANLASSANVAVLTGTGLELATGSDGYVLSGTAQSVQVAPTYLARWGIATATTTVPAGTALRFQVVDSTGTPVPDAALPGNSAGFTESADLSGLSTTTYPSLALAAQLSTSATTSTPVLEAWSLSYARGPVPFGPVPFSLTGIKAIGSTGAGAPIYKTSVSTSTDSGGNRTLSLEWDSYALSLSAFDVVSACTAPPYALSPGSSVETSLMVGSSTSNMVLVSVRDASGALPATSVTLTGTSYSMIVDTDACGSAYFGGLGSGSYSVTAAKTGYTTFSASGVTVSGHVFYPVSME